MSNRLASAIIAVSAVYSAPVFAEQITLGTFPIPKMVEDENTGVFVELTKALCARAGCDVKVQVSPPKRTVTDFMGGGVDGFFPALAPILPGPAARSEAIYVKRDFAFTRAGEPAISSFDALTGKTVAVTSGYPYAPEVTGSTAFKLEWAKSDPTNVRKLVGKRVDAFIVEEKTGLTAIADAGQSDAVHYDAGAPISELDVFYAFADTTEGKALAERFTKALADMKADGSFAEIMSKAE